MNIFNTVATDFFKPLAGKNREIFADCIEIIYDVYLHELSFGIEKEYVLNKLIDYFSNQSDDLVFEDSQVAVNPRDKSNEVLRRLKECGWIEYETASDYTIHITLIEQAAAMVEALHNIQNRNEMEYEASIASIYSILKNDDLYAKPYRYILKEVYLRTKDLINELKKLNTGIKKYIDRITLDKEADEIIKMFFEYQNNIGSKAFMRIHTSENASRFRGFILERLQQIKDNRSLMSLAVKEYKELEECDSDIEAETAISEIISDVSNALEYTYSEIEHEITVKNDRYVQTAVARAKFKLTNGNDITGKLSAILKTIADEINENDEPLNDYISDDVEKLFELLPQSVIDDDSLAPVVISRNTVPPEEISVTDSGSEEERAEIRRKIKEKQADKFSRKNIGKYVSTLLSDKKSVLASEIPIHSRRDMLRIIYIGLYGRYGKSDYTVSALDNEVAVNGCKFRDFKIERK